MFIWSDKELNEEQSNAVRHEGNVLLIACPGSGKTRTLTYKIAYELSKLDSHGQFVIAITYTNRAADEIKERVELLGVDTKQLWIGTIHSFCLEWILRPYSLYIPELKNGFKVINTFDAEEIITDLCKEYNKTHNPKYKNKITYWDCKIIASIDGLIPENSSAKVRNILEKYFQILKNNKQITFEHILYYSYILINERPLIGEILSKVFPLILIDEYQDTKEIQYLIISAITKVNRNNIKLFVVGDPNQSIYGGLGGYPIDKKDLEELSGLNIDELSLKNNYRSSKKIIRYFQPFETYDNVISASGRHSNFESKICFDMQVEREVLIDKIAELISYNIEKLGISPNEICVLAPQWVHLASATRQLIAKLPQYSFDGPGMSPFSRDIDNFWFKLSKIILSEPSPDIYVRRLRWASEILKELDSVGADTSKYTAKTFLRLINSIDINESDGLKYLEEFFLKLFKSINLNISDYLQIEEHYKSFFKSANARINRLENEGVSFAGTTETFRKVFKQKKGITVSTFHGVKGAEYDTVIAFALLEGYIPHFLDDNGKENAKKLLYVIASRARKHIFLIAEKGRFNNQRPPREYKATENLVEYKYSYDVR